MRRGFSLARGVQNLRERTEGGFYMSGLSSISSSSLATHLPSLSSGKAAQSSGLGSGSGGGGGASGDSTTISTNADGSLTVTVTNAKGQIVSASTTQASGAGAPQSSQAATFEGQGLAAASLLDMVV